MSEVRIAKRYAKSLLELAIERGVLEKVYEDMLLFDKTIKQNRQLYLMLRNPVVKHAQKRIVLEKLFQNKIDPMTMSFLNIVCGKSRTYILPFVGSEYFNQYNVHKGIERAEIITATEITDDLRKEFTRIVMQVSNAKSVYLKEKVNPDLIGGFILKINDRQIDDSISGRLQSLRNKLITQYYN